MATVTCLPLADGGDGLVSAMSVLPGSETREVVVPDPLGRPVEAVWLCRGDLAIIEMAQASGLHRLRADEYAPLCATTAGSGLLIKAALDAGCRRVVIGLGGSATVDGGAGMLSALGFGLLDKRGRPIAPGGAGLLALANIIVETADARLSAAQFIGLADVDNPLLGPTGAARVFGPQKGAAPAEIEVLECGLQNWAALLERIFGIRTHDLPGAGAAGGMGAACLAALSAKLMPGAQWVAEQCGLDEALCRADWVMTGEGRLDGQTAHGKAPAYVARQAAAAGKPVIALGGLVEPNLDLRDVGISECRAIAPAGTPVEESIRNAAVYLERAAAQATMEFKGKHL
jgi:glycerate kinase